MEVDDCMIVLQQVQECRAKLSQSGSLMNDVGSIVTNVEHSPPRKSLWLVVDANIFLHKESTLEETMWGKYNGAESVILVIPWMVIQELDHIKDDKSRHPDESVAAQKKLVIQPCARGAINQINKWLSDKNPHLDCQTATMSKEIFEEVSIESNDDRILQYCVQYKSLYADHEVALLSMGVNLRNKAMILFLDAYTLETLLKLPTFVPHRQVAGPRTKDTPVLDHETESQLIAYLYCS